MRIILICRHGLELSLVVGRLCVTSTLTRLFPGENERLIRLDQHDIASTDASLLFPHGTEPRHRFCARPTRMCDSCEPRPARAQSSRCVLVTAGRAHPRRNNKPRTGTACPALTQAIDLPAAAHEELHLFTDRRQLFRTTNDATQPPAGCDKSSCRYRSRHSTKKCRLPSPPPLPAIPRVPVELIVPMQFVYRQR